LHEVGQGVCLAVACKVCLNPLPPTPYHLHSLPPALSSPPTPCPLPRAAGPATAGRLRWRCRHRP
jgi:hypothetical protein